MDTNELNAMNELAGRIEGLGRTLMHLVAQLEDEGLINGPAFTDNLRHTFALKPDASLLLRSAKNTVERAANALDEARGWRRFRRQVVASTRPKRKAG